MSSVFNQIEGFISAPFRAIGGAIYDSPIVGDGLHIVDNMFTGGRKASRVFRDEAPKLVKSGAQVIEGVADVIPTVVEDVGSVVSGVGGFLSSPFLIPGLAVGAFLLLNKE